jgi:hypothetical protein
MYVPGSQPLEGDWPQPWAEPGRGLCFFDSQLHGFAFPLLPVPQRNQSHGAGSPAMRRHRVLLRHKYVSS